MAWKTDQTEFVEEIYRSRYAAIVAIARCYAPTPELVQDIVQQAYLELLEKARDGSLASVGDPVAYLYEITRNKARRSWQRYKRESSEVMQRIAGELMSRRVEEPGSSLKNDAMTLLNECIGQLPEKSRNLIREFYWDGNSTKKISLDEGVSQSAICQALYRIRLQLKKCIEWKNRHEEAES